MSTLDGSYGEGGGQIVRTALSLSAVTGRPFRLSRIRAGRHNPGLLPQHLSAVRAAAAITGAAVSGDRLGSTELSFSPTHPPRSGSYAFDVAETAQRGSAGSVSLILQTLLVPLALADRASTVVLRGGTHVEWSPSFDDLVHAYFPALRRIGFRIDAELRRWGWYPVGNGEISCEIGIDRGGPRLNPIQMADRGPLRQVAGHRCRRKPARSHSTTHGGSSEGIAWGPWCPRQYPAAARYRSRAGRGHFSCGQVREHGGKLLWLWPAW